MSLLRIMCSEKEWKISFYEYYIGIDLGTSAIKLLLVREDGTILHSVSKSYPLSFPHPEGDTLLGWDTGEFPFNVYDATLCMYEVLKNGGLTGGFNFDSKNRRPSYTVEDMFYAFILGMDTFALGLIKAAEMIEDGRIDAFVKERYSSWENELGQKIRNNETTLAELSAYAEKLGAPELHGSGRQEYLESVMNQILFK